MQRPHVIAFFSLMGILATVPGQAKTVMHLISGFGAGQMPCAKWTADERAGGAQAKTNREWVFGYLSAWQDYATGRRVSLDLEANDMLTAVDRNCAVSPDESVSTVLSQFLYRRYEKRWGLKRAD
jgi:hypothetical protein